MENTSGRGDAAEVPPEIDRWNWGAFWLSWIWGIGNRTYIALLALVPFVGLVMPFVLGAKGSAWAWRNKHWESVEVFRAVQRKWARWGVAIALLIILSTVLFAAILFFVISSAFRNSEVHQAAVAVLNAHPEAVQVLGQPVSTGMPMGEIRVSGPEGEASLSFTVKGPDGAGKVYLKAKRVLGQWEFEGLVLEEAGSGERIDLME